MEEVTIMRRIVAMAKFERMHDPVPVKLVPCSNNLDTFVDTNSRWQCSSSTFAIFGCSEMLSFNYPPFTQSRNRDLAYFQLLNSKRFWFDGKRRDEKSNFVSYVLSRSNEKVRIFWGGINLKRRV